MITQKEQIIIHNALTDSKGYAEIAYSADVVAELKAERDRYKARVEALERALKEFTECETCANDCEWPKSCGTCEVSFGETGKNNYQFDEARFTGESE